MKPARAIESPYLTAQEAIAYLRLPSRNPSQLYRLIREHRLPFRRRGRVYIFNKFDLDDWTKGVQVQQPAFRRRA